MSFVSNYSFLALTCSSLIACSQAHAGEKKGGVPHIVVFDDMGALAIEIHELTPFDMGGIPTMTLYTSNFNQAAGEYTTRPLSGLSSGFINDDLGYEAESPLIGSSIRLTLTTIESGSDPFFVALGASFLVNAGQSITLGSSFDTHPTYGLLSSNPNFTGSASLIFTLNDANQVLSGSQTFRLILSADPEDGVVQSEPCSMADLNNDGILDFFDVSAFLSAFSSNDDHADLTHDGIFDFFDVSAFLSAFALGCP